jgi:hypothetical protein
LFPFVWSHCTTTGKIQRRIVSQHFFVPPAAAAARA